MTVSIRMQLPYRRALHKIFTPTSSTVIDQQVKAIGHLIWCPKACARSIGVSSPLTHRNESSSDLGLQGHIRWGTTACLAVQTSG